MLAGPAGMVPIAPWSTLQLTFVGLPLKVALYCTAGMAWPTVTVRVCSALGWTSKPCMLLPVLEGPTKLPLVPPAPPMLEAMLDAVLEVPPAPVLPPVPEEAPFELVLPLDPHAPSVALPARTIVRRRSQFPYEKRRSIPGD